MSSTTNSPAPSPSSFAFIGPLLMTAGAAGLAVWGSSLIRVFELLTVSTADLPWPGVAGSGGAMVSSVVFALGATFVCRHLVREARRPRTTPGTALAILAGILQIVAAGFVLTGIRGQQATFQALATSQQVPRPEILQAGVDWATSQVQTGWIVLVVATICLLAANFLVESRENVQRRLHPLLGMAVVIGCLSALGFAAGWLLAWQQMQSLQGLLAAQLPKPTELAARLNAILLGGMLIGIMLGGMGTSTILAAILTRGKSNP